MKGIVLVIITAFPFVLSSGPYDSMARDIYKEMKDKKSPVAVLPFVSTDSVDSDAKIATAEFERVFVRIGAVVTERAQIDKVIEEQELQQTGIFSDKNAAEIGKGVGAQYAVIGSVTRFNKYSNDAENTGLRVNVKIVDVSTFRIIAVSKGEVDASDLSSEYKRKNPRQPSRYPAFLDLYFSATFYNHTGKYDVDTGLFSEDTFQLNEKMKRGIGGGIRYISSSEGFYAGAFEFSVDSQNHKDYDSRVTQYSINWIPMLRIPLWVYAPSLPNYTSVYAGMPVGFLVNSVDYKDGSDKKKSRGIGVNFEFIGGMRLGISESVSFFTDIRYRPKIPNWIWRKENYDDTREYLERYKGYKISAGLSLAP